MNTTERTPEQLAEEWLKVNLHAVAGNPFAILPRLAFLAGHSAAMATVKETIELYRITEERLEAALAHRNYHQFMPTPHCVYGRCIDCDETEQDGAHFSAEDGADRAIAREEGA